MTQTSILEKDETSSSCGQLQLHQHRHIQIYPKIKTFRPTAQRRKGPHVCQYNQSIKWDPLCFVLSWYFRYFHHHHHVHHSCVMLTIPVMLTLPTVQVCKRIIKQQLAESHSMCEYANYVQVDTMLMMSVFKSIQSRSWWSSRYLRALFCARRGRSKRVLSNFRWDLGKVEIFQRYLSLPWAFLDIIQTLHCLSIQVERTKTTL